MPRGNTYDKSNSFNDGSQWENDKNIDIATLSLKKNKQTWLLGKIHWDYILICEDNRVGCGHMLVTNSSYRQPRFKSTN